LKATEAQLLAFIEKLFPKPPKGVLGMGDDAASFKVPAGQRLVVTTDTLCENVHFRRAWSSPVDLARQSLHVNLSDIASMGARPWAYFLNLKIPRQEDGNYLSAYLKALAKETKKERILLLGGNISRASELSLDFSFLGLASESQIKCRSGARPGDVLCVTEPLGLSAAGLRLLSQKRTRPSSLEKTLIQAHLQPCAQRALGLLLAKEKNVTAMMDLSDGLAADLPKLCKSSGVGARLDAALFPFARSLIAVCEKRGWQPLDFFWWGGEDYKLLFTVRLSAFESLAKKLARSGYSLYPLGICQRAKAIELRAFGRRLHLKGKSFEHLA
jgi:thiamine-monophosphate kinase